MPMVDKVVKEIPNMAKALPDPWKGVYLAVGDLIVYSKQDTLNTQEKAWFRRACQKLVKVMAHYNVPLYPWPHYWFHHFPDLVDQYNGLTQFSLCGLEHNHKRSNHWKDRTTKMMEAPNHGDLKPGLCEVLVKDNCDLYCLIHLKERAKVS